MSFELADDFARACVPERRRGGRDEDRRAVRAEHRAGRARSRHKPREDSAVFRVPERLSAAERLVRAGSPSGQDPFPIAGGCRVVQGAGLGESPQFGPGGRVPDLRLEIAADGEDACAVRAESESVDEPLPKVAVEMS
jgi:hypothetical protein